MTWLVTGGAGYIGAHILRSFQSEGIDVVVLDDLSTGHADFVPDGVPFVKGSILNRSAVDEGLAGRTSGPVDGVVHLAGFKFAGESVARPLHTYEQNVEGTRVLLGAMADHGVERIVFSSSAATYGTPDVDVVTEETPTTPESPYGESKLIGEWLIRDQARSVPLRHTALRYFNVVGSAHDEVYDSSAHNLFPLVLKALTDGRTPRINGDDYPTADGTCVRDYIHVGDLADAHVAAARALLDGRDLAPVYNLGSGDGSSVRQIMDAVVRVTGQAFEPEVGPRRPGDPARIVASGELASADLGWTMRHSLDEMVATAWRSWQQVAGSA